jgi:crotonobetainyl-CoA:carnitine CoA-transferase CaiB-like acyl-CoA transferase
LGLEYLQQKKPEGKALFLQLVETMDALLENYRPTVMPRAGLGFDALHEVSPRPIYAQLFGLVYNGPYSGRGPDRAFAMAVSMLVILLPVRVCHVQRIFAGRRRFRPLISSAPLR